MLKIEMMRNAARPFLLPIKSGTRWMGRWRRRTRYLRDGIEGICMELRSTIDCCEVLREYGAHVGKGTVVYGPFHVMNADRDFSNLHIGENAYVGTDVLVDLADTVWIGDFVSVSARSSLVTHFDVGPGPLKARRPHTQGPVRVEDGAYLGVSVTVLQGVTIGADATIGAYSLLRKDVAPGSTWVAPEASQLIGR